MKLSDVKEERTLDVVADIIEPIANIAMDKVAAELFTKKQVPEGMTVKEFMLQRVKKSVPVIFKTHKEDIIAILSAIEGITPEEYVKSLNMGKLFKDVVELMTDEDFAVLFTSEQSENTSGSASENTQVSEK